MGRCTILVTNELMGRIRDPNGRIARSVWLVSDAVSFCDGTKIATIETPLLADGYNGMMDIIIRDDETIDFKRDCDV